MLERIKQLEIAGDWAELHALAETLPVGDALARVHLAFSKRLAETATTAADYRVAIDHGRKAVDSADSGGLLHTWALARVAILAADMGAFKLAKPFAIAFEGALKLNPAAAPIAPWAFAALGRVHYYQGRHSNAVDLFRSALSANVGGEFQERIQLWLTWALASAGKVAGARLACPSSVSHISTGHLLAARALICSHLGLWEDAYALAEDALRCHAAGEWETYDTILIAETRLILQKAADALGLHESAKVWGVLATKALSGWNEYILTQLVPNLPGKGGDVFAAASPSRGLPVGHKRTGLLGAVG